MADRFPLIVDSTTQTIKELPSGDNLDLTGSSIVNASSIDVTGNVSADEVISSSIISSSSTNPRLRLFETDTTDLNTQFQNQAGDFFIKTIPDDASTSTNRFAIDHSTGDISFYDDTGVSQSFFWDASEESLGIGTSSPTAPITIGYSGAEAQLQINNSGSSRMVYLGAFSDNEGILRLFNSSNVETVRIPAESTAGVHTYFNAGNVGIGTSTVNRKLEIAGNNNGGAKANYIRITDTDTSATADNQQGGIEFYTSDATAGIAASIEVLYAGSGGGGEFTFNTAASSDAGVVEAMRIDESGNVGIGTSSPDTTLTVFGGGVAQFRVGNIGPSNNSAIRVSRNDTSVTSGNPLGYLEFGGNDSTSNLDTSFAYVGAEASGAHAAGDNPTDLVFGTTADNTAAPVEAMRIDASGNVGIGNDSPSSYNGIAGTKVLAVGSTSGNNGVNVVSGSTSTGSYMFSDGTNDRGGFAYYHTADLMTVSTGGAEAMRIDASGNLLVGTTSTNPYTSSTETGAVVRGDEGILGASRDGGPSLRVNRIGTGGTEEGDIAEFRSNGVTVGSIGTASTALYIANNDTGLQLYGGGATDQIVPCDGSGATRDNAIDLGKTTGRFKDLYLSGFVSDGGDTGLTTRAIINGGVTALRLQQARGSLTSPTISNFDGDGNYIVSEVYDGSSFNKIAHIGMVTGTSLDDGEILFGTAKAGTVTNKMVLNEDGNLLVGTTAGGSYRLTSTVPSGADRDVFLAGVTLATNGLAIQWKHATTSLSVKFNDILTTASAANAYLDSGAGNELYRSTSSIRYKKDVESIDEQHSSNVLNLRPVWYRSKAAGDNANHSFYGLIAEEVAEIEPRLVHWAYAEKDYDVEEVEGSIKKTPKPDAQKIPDGVQYERLAVLLLDVVKKQSAQIDDLRARVAALES